MDFIFIQISTYLASLCWMNLGLNLKVCVALSQESFVLY